MLDIKRSTDEVRVNEIVNDPSIYPWVKGSHTGPIDLKNIVANQNNFVLEAEHGCIIFFKHQIGIYECHTNVLPSGRGPWVEEYGAGAMHWMFTKTDCCEILTKCPKNNIMAKLAARKCHFKEDFETRPIWPTDSGFVSIDVYSLKIQDWARYANGLVDKGKWFHNVLETEYSRLNKPLFVHEEDEVHDRYVGAAIDMIEGGQVSKAIHFYNRWAIMSNYKPVSIFSVDPFVIDIDESKLRIVSNRFEVI